MKSKYIRSAIIIGVLLLISAIVAVVLVYNGVVLLNNPSETDYPVRGVDVSSYQGDIEWQILSSQNIDFAFIKATEGSSFVDPCFIYNFSEAQKCSISVGALRMQKIFHKIFVLRFYKLSMQISKLKI